jgi:hypothetical protein
MKIIKQRELEEFVTYAHIFDLREQEGRGFMFDCDEDGNVEVLPPGTQDNYSKCISGEYDVVDKGIRKFRHTYWHPAVGICDDCGSEVELRGFTNTCDCGADYNMSGQRLAPRSQWGEETGEPWYECY